MADPPTIIRFFNMATLPQLKENERFNLTADGLGAVKDLGAPPAATTGG
jgi:hypothetical protein